MTELEEQLQSALGSYSRTTRKAGQWENAFFAEWRTMSGLMQQENAALAGRVTDLSRRAEFEEQLRRGCREDERDRGAPGAGALQRSIRSAGAGAITQRQRTYDGPSLSNKPDVIAGAFGGDLR